MAKKKISPINEDFDFKLFFTIAKKNMFWFFLFMLLASIISFLILRYTLPTYEVFSVIKISSQDNAQNVLGINSKDGIYGEQNKIAGDIELIRSKVIVERAIKKLPLNISYYAKGTVLEFERYRQSPFVVESRVIDSSIYNQKVFVDFIDKNNLILSYVSTKEGIQKNVKGKVGVWMNLPEVDIKVEIEDFKEIEATQQQISKDAYYFVLNIPSEVAEKVLQKLNVYPLNPEAKTVAIKLQEKNSRKAADIVNAIANEFNVYDVERSSEVANKIIDFIDNTIASIDLQLSNSENSLEDFKRKNKLIDPEKSITSVITKLESLQNTLFAIDHELNLYQKIRKDIGQNNDIGKFILSISGTSDNTIIVSQLSRLQDLLQQREEILLSTTVNSEIYKSTELKLQTQREIISRTLTNEEEQLKTRRDDLQRQINDNDSKFGQIPGQQAEYGRLLRLFTINEKFYSLLLEKKAEFAITRAGYVPQHVILQEGKATNVPISPNAPLVISTCLMIGFILTLILILVRYLLYNEINALEEIGQYTDAALLGIVPKYKRDIPVSQLLVDKNPKSVISEAFRSIRTNLQFISNDTDAKIVAVTSTISGEGKTFNAINLAGVMAFSGKKVVILDLDMRKPKIHLGFNVENISGISTLLIGKDKVENCITHSSLNNLDFITAGPIPPNPAELIINPRMNELITYLKTIYDIIIVDLPPVGIVSDGIPIMQLADYPLYILRANYSRKMFIIQINKLIEENNVKNLSVILNGVEMSKLKYGYGYGYSYGYGYGYGYSYGYGYYDESDDPKSDLQKGIDFILRRKS
jgi:tyrosine-protein kinase Etk/Wzc